MMDSVGWMSLPREVQLRILQYCDIRKKLTLGTINKQFYELLQDGAAWNEFYLYQECLLKKLKYQQLHRLILKSTECLIRADFRGSSAVRISTIFNLCEFCPNIRWLNLRGCKELSKELQMMRYNQIITTWNHRLSRLDLGYIRDISLLRYFLSSCDGTLQYLDISGNILTTSIIDLISKHQYLRTLKMDECDILGGMQTPLITSRLTCLSANGCPTMNLSLISSCSNLSCVYLNNCQLSVKVEQLKYLAALSEVKTLCLADNDLNDEHVITITSQMHNLQNLDLEDNNVTDYLLKDIRYLGYCKSLETLCLSSCAQVSNQGVICLLKSCRKLRSLELNNCQSITNVLLVSILQYTAESAQKQYTQQDLVIPPLLQSIDLTDIVDLSANLISAVVNSVNRYRGRLIYDDESDGCLISELILNSTQCSSKFLVQSMSDDTLIRYRVNSATSDITLVDKENIKDNTTLNLIPFCIKSKWDCFVEREQVDQKELEKVRNKCIIL
ncbi:hypothetical protein MIR68_009901 [Amoeboaphelidium protococcarum]|nr:hypothetical protein MIR68_009901 [Amoeboaphelidium protococcarum]